MDLNHQNITLGELLADPRSSAVLHRRFGRLLRHPMAPAASCLTLSQLVQMAAFLLPQKAIRETLEELEAL